MPAPQAVLRGLVVEQLLNVGSKSEQPALLLDTGTGLYQLRRIGGNPFHDPGLRDLLGETVEVHGLVKGMTVFFTAEPKLLETA